MAVYTHVSDEDLTVFLSEYDIGTPISFKGIAEGVENSNYYLETSKGRFILTLFEKRVDAEDLPYFVALKRHLSAKGFPCPQPILARNGEALQTLSGRPAIIISFLEGLSPKTPDIPQCRQLGAGLARMHLALADFKMTRANTLGPKSWPGLWSGLESAADTLQPGLSALIEDELETLGETEHAWRELPQGTIHADLFPDNAFFLGETFSGVIDFYFACTGALAYDLGICINAWCFEDDTANAKYNVKKSRALIEGYESERPLSVEEKRHFPSLARGAAIRFFITRLIDLQEIRPDALVTPKTPLEYAYRLARHREIENFDGYVG